MVECNALAISSCSPKNERYLTARIIGELPKIYGTRGEILVGFYTYFRWLDNMVDDKLLTKNATADLLTQEKKFMRGDITTPESEGQKIISKLPIDSLPNKSQIMDQAYLLVCAIEEDNLEELQPKNLRESRHHNWRTMLPCFEAMNLILNGKPLRPTYGFMKLLDAWTNIANLLDLEKDLACGLSQLPFTREQKEMIMQTMPENRGTQIWQLVNEENYNSRKNLEIKNLKEFGQSFLDLNMPIWQRLLCCVYMVRANIKARIKLKYPRH